MKLGVFTTLFSHMEFEEMLDYVQAAGLHAVEIGTGCYPGGSHCNLDILLESEQARSVYIEHVQKET